MFILIENSSGATGNHQCSTSQKERRNGQERTNSFPREANVVAGERGASVLLSALKQKSGFAVLLSFTGAGSH